MRVYNSISGGTCSSAMALIHRNPSVIVNTGGNPPEAWINIHLLQRKRIPIIVLSSFTQGYPTYYDYIKNEKLKPFYKSCNHKAKRIHLDRFYKSVSPVTVNIGLIKGEEDRVTAFKNTNSIRYRFPMLTFTREQCEKILRVHGLSVIKTGCHDLAYGYSVPLRKLKDLPEAQATLIEKIVEGMKGEYYGGITTVEKAEEFVTQIVKQINDKEELLAKYGSCPACGSKDISKWRGEEHLNCESCNHSWHGITKEPWEYYEVKQNLERMGIEVEEVGPEKLKFTPKEVADMITRKERLAQEKEEGELPEKFRCKVRLLALLEPMIAGDNIQKLEIRDEKIEIQLIEGMDLYFNGLRKDYKAGEKARIECSGWGGGESIVRNHDHINMITALDPYNDISQDA